MSHIANHRYVVQGRRDSDGRVWPIHATDELSDAQRVLAVGRDIDGQHWSGARIFDRRDAIMPQHGWGSLA
jgi:hypothetical protein